MPDDLRRALRDATAAARSRGRRPLVRAATTLPPVRRVRERLRRAERARDAARAEADQARRQRDRARTERDDLRARLEQASAEREALRQQQDQLTARGEQRRAQAVRSAEQARGQAYAYRRLRAASVGSSVPATLGAVRLAPPEPDQVRDDAARTLRQARLAPFAETLVAGGTLEEAAAELVRAAAGPSREPARSIVQNLYDHPETRTAGTVGTGLLAMRAGLSSFAWQRLSSLPDEVWLRTVPAEYVGLAEQHDLPACRRALDLALERDPDLSAQTWLALASAALGRELSSAPALVDRLGAALDGLPEPDASRLEPEHRWLQRWTPRVLQGRPEAPALPEGTVAIGVMGYDQPSLRRTSVNIGDHIQTLGSLVHVVRRTGCRFEDDALGRLAQELAARVPQDRRLGSPERRVRLVPIDRDASSHDPVPEGTWLLAFGWYAHQIADGRYDLPFDERIRPIYVSFHVNRRDLLTEEMVAHLRRCAPIGCRDWSTVDLLLGLDVPAFFSGCITTTTRDLKPDDAPRPPADAPVTWVDIAPEGDPTGELVRNERPEVAHQSLEANLREALALLDRYVSGTSRVVTSRLHAYLPARAMGLEVDFRPKNRSDIRFNGLDPLTDEQVAAMGTGIGDLLEAPISRILAGDDEPTVRAAWSQATAELVDEARERAAAQVPLPRLVDIGSTVAAVRGAAVHRPAPAAPDGAPIDLVLALDGNLKEQLLVVLDGIVEHTRRPVHVHILCRDHDDADRERCHRLFPELTFTWLPCDTVDHGSVHGMLRHITVSTMDRLLLPELLADVDRVIYHDMDALPLVDLAELYETDLQGRPLAARDNEASAWISGYQNVVGPATSSALAPEVGHELLRRESARHGYDWVAFNAGIMVLDLQRMRADGFCEEYVAYAGHFGMHDQHILNVYAGPDREPLAPRWNARPTQEEVADPAIVHWAGGQKPWDVGYVHHQDLWRRQEQRVRTREAALTGDLG